MYYREFVCEYCSKSVKQEVKHRYQAKQKRRFCSRVCSNKWMHENGILDSRGKNNPMSGKTVHEIWIEKHGKEKAQELIEARRHRQKRANAGENNGMFGKSHSVESRQKMSTAHSGKTLEERWGEERAQAYKAELSERMSGSGNPMFGKTSSGGRSVKGMYKGFFFRSLLEYSYMKYLESQGSDLNDIEYETIRIRVNESMTYKPDFFIPSTKTLVEVKPAYATQSEKNLIKFEAARYYCNERGWSFIVMTENDFPKISFADAQQDEHVVFDERTFEYFLRT